MMRKHLLLETLHAVEQVEVAFEQTLRTIDDIGHRYNLVAELKQTCNDRQRCYEMEIQAAITEPSFTKLSSRLKRKKRVKKRLVYKRRAKPKSAAIGTQTPSPDEVEEEAPYVSLQTNYFYQIKKAPQTKENTTYRSRIRQLHEAAHAKLKAIGARTGSNRRDKPRPLKGAEDQSSSESEGEEESCGAYCCCSCSCQCHYYS